MSRVGPPASPVQAVVVAFGAPELLDRCLDSLVGGPPVTVVDNSSDPTVRSVVSRHGADYVDPGRNLGFAGAVNTALAMRADSDLLLVNPDATIGPEQVAALRRCLHVDDRLACVAPVQHEPGSLVDDRVAWPFPTPAGAWIDAVGLGRLRRRTEFVIGSVLLLRSEALVDVGPFDEQFFLYAEETDWQRRACDRGWSVRLCREVSATHVGAGTGGDPQLREIHFHASQERYMRKHHGHLGWGVYRTAVLAGSIPRALVLRGDRRDLAAGRVRLYARGPARVEDALSHPPAGAVTAERNPR
jgi:GT2 family glycosyltransferase